MSQSTPVEAFMKGQRQPERHYDDECKKPIQQSDACGGLDRHSKYLRKYNNSNHLNAATNSGNLHNAAECHEPDKDHNVGQGQPSRDWERTEESEQATHDNGPFEQRIEAQQGQVAGTTGYAHALAEGADGYP